MKELKTICQNSEKFLFTVINEKWENVFKGKKISTEHSSEELDWPIRFEAFSYIANKHPKDLGRFRDEINNIWKEWISLYNHGSFGDKNKHFWPSSHDVAYGSLTSNKLDTENIFAPGNEIECHISMFRARDIFSITGYAEYFDHVIERIGYLLFENPHLSAYSDHSGHPFRTKAATCRSEATLGSHCVP